MSPIPRIDAFISYTTCDYETYAAPLKRYLNDAGIEAWIAPERLYLGDEYPQEIVRAIEACRCLVVVLSKALEQSKHVPRELGLALEGNKRLVAIKVDREPIPDRVRYYLSGCHILDAAEHFEGSVQRLVDQLRQLLGVPVDAMPESAITAAGVTQVESGIVSLWRNHPGNADYLEFVPADAFDDGEHRKRIGFPLTAGSMTIGRRELGHPTVSRKAVSLRRENGRIWLRRELECRAVVFVGLEMLEPNQERLLVHDRLIRIGRVEGTFLDHRYHPTNLSPTMVSGRPEQVVDERTGLLSQFGLAGELDQAQRKGQSRWLLLVSRGSEDFEHSCRLALALHLDNPEAPAARWEHVAALLLDNGEAKLDSVRALEGSEPLRAGIVRVSPNSGSALGQITDAVAALERTSPWEHGKEPVNLRDYWLSLRDLTSFLHYVTTSDFGEVGIVAIEEYGRLTQNDVKAMERVERDLMVDLDHEVGKDAVFARVVPGVVAFAGELSAERAARQVAARWRERGPIAGQVFEVDSQLAFEVVPRAAFGALGSRAKELAAAVADGVTAQGLPYPIAVHAHAVLEASTPEVARAAAEHLRSATQSFCQIVLCSLSASQPDASPLRTESRSWAELCEEIVPRMTARSDRLGEFARSLADGSGRLNPELLRSLEALGELTRTSSTRQETEPQRLRAAVKAVLLALKGLRRWTLISVERFERADPFSDRKSLQYVDHTGPTPAGVRRQLILVRDLPLGPFVYLARLAEAIAFPLEPFLRRRLSVTAHEQQLFSAQRPFFSSGQYPYLNASGSEQFEPVDSRQIPRALQSGSGEARVR